MEFAGVGDIVIDPRKIEEDEILGEIGRAFDLRDEVRDQLICTIPSVKETVLGLFAQVQGLRA